MQNDNEPVAKNLFDEAPLSPLRKAEPKFAQPSFEPRAIASEAKFEKPPTHFTCVRCGNFVETYQPGLEACADCLEKVLPEGVRGPISFVTVVNGVAHLAWQKGLLAALLALLFRLPGSVLFAIADVDWRVRAAYEIVPLMADTAIMVMAHECLLGRNITLPSAFSRAASRYFVVFRTRYLSSLFVLLWSTLLFVPGVFKTLGYALSEPIALFEDETASASIEASGERTDPYYGVLAATYGVAYLTTSLWAFAIPTLGYLARAFQMENHLETPHQPGAHRADLGRPHLLLLHDPRRLRAGRRLHKDLADDEARGVAAAPIRSGDGRVTSPRRCAV